MTDQPIPTPTAVPAEYSMHGSLKGRLQRISLCASSGLQPLFEAITNSLQAIEESGRKDGLVEITVGRDMSQALMEESLQPIRDITVRDNGAGFTDGNFTSFITPDSLRKFHTGGKGIGRLLWLKAFEKVEVESVFADESTVARRRSFTFLVDDANPIQHHSLSDLATTSDSHTVVKLLTFLAPYRDKLNPKPETVADRITVRFLLHFLDPACPRVILRDGGQEIDLNARFRDDRVRQVLKEPIRVKDHALDALFLQMKFGGRRKHTMHLCAAGVEVENTEIDKLLPHIPDYLPDVDGTPTRLAVYVTGDLLTRTVNDQRTAFNLPKEEGDAYDPTLQEVITACCSVIAERFSDLIGKEKDRAEERVRTFIKNRRQVYRPLLGSIGDYLPRLEKCTTDDALDKELNTIVREMELQAEAEFGKYRDPAQHMGEDALKSILAKITEASRVRLSQYVARRRAVLYVLKRLLEKRGDGNYNLEADVHDLVFPMGKTSDEVPVDRWNLWLIDERLAFHEYLASDKPLKSQAPFGVDAPDEPDLLVLNRPGAFAPGYQLAYDSIVIVEFKRPMRQDLGIGELPHKQALRYINKIQTQSVADTRGRPINARKPTRFLCYLVCDLTQQLKAELRDDGFHASPDELSFFMTVSNPEQNRFVHYEYVALDRLYDDAEKRNLALFDKLGIVPDPEGPGDPNGAPTSLE